MKAHRAMSGLTPAKFRSLPRSAKRWARLKLLQLLRAPGGATFVAMGFSVGFFCEMFTLPTYGLAFFLIFPLVYLLRGSLAGALVGFALGKIIYLPLMYVHKAVGGWVLPSHMEMHLPLVGDKFNHMLLLNLKLIVGGIVDGLWIGALLFITVRSVLVYVKAKRKERRRMRRISAAPAEI